MKVLLAGNYAPDRQFSMLGFADALRRELPAQGVNVSYLSPPIRLGKPGTHPKLAKWAGYVDKFVLFRRDLRQAAKEVDLVHLLDQGNALWVPWIADRPHLVTVHDLIALRAALGEIDGWTLGPSGQKLQTALSQSLSKARNVVTVSKATQADFRRLYPQSPEPGLIRNGLYRPFARMTGGEAREAVASLLPDPDRPFLLHVGNNWTYKNRLGAIAIHRAMRRLDPERTPRLVMAGHFLAIEIRIEAKPELREGTIVEIANPTDEQVQALYSLAQGMIFPSLLEGFGLPILEAQACGCPVFASDRAPLPEVGGEGAVYFDPSNPESAAQRILEAQGQLPDLVRSGHRNVADRRPERMAAAYAAAYHMILPLTT